MIKIFFLIFISHHFLNSLDQNPDFTLKLDPLNNNYFFNKYLIINKLKLISCLLWNNKSNNIDSSLNGLKRLLFPYKDIYRAQLLTTILLAIYRYAIHHINHLSTLIKGVKKIKAKEQSKIIIIYKIY